MAKDNKKSDITSKHLLIENKKSFPYMTEEQ